MMSITGSAPRGPKNTTRGTSNRGGIQKRRAGPTRVDKDGDLVMGAAAAVQARKSGKGTAENTNSSRSARGTGGGRGGATRGGLNVQRAQAAILRGLGAKQGKVTESRGRGGTTIRVIGLKSSKAASNSDGGLDSLLSFLERKASALDSKSNRTVKIKKSHISGDSVILTASPDDAAVILKLNNYQFAGTNLTIEPNENSTRAQKASPSDQKEGMSKEAQEIQTRIQAILAGRYDVSLKLLNLAALGQDTALVEMGMLDGTKRISKLFPVLMAICDKLFTTRQAKQDAIESITLADNELSDLSNITLLAQTFPDLKNLDLSRNNFTTLKSLEAWRWKFRNLENLVMIGNPIEIQVPSYTTDLIQWFPKLRILNGTLVRSDEQIAAEAIAAEKARAPIPINPPLFHDVSQVGENFIRSFVKLYDTDRMALLTNYYDAQSVYSLSVNMTAPRGSNNKTAIAPWAPYTKHSRNLVKMTHLPTRMARKHTGTQDIHSVWVALPATRHPDLETNFDKYLIECQPLPGLVDPTGASPRGVDGLILTIHGEFEEELANPSANATPSMRSFSRTFVLGPGPPGGLPIRIVSDTMVLRAWAPLAKPNTTNTDQSDPRASPALSDSDIQQRKEAMALQLVERTGMTPNYSLLCLTETGWDLEMAFAAFIANKDNLPADAFLATAQVQQL